MSKICPLRHEREYIVLLTPSFSRRFWHRRAPGVGREDNLPLAHVQRGRQRDWQAAGRGKGLAHVRLVGEKDWTGKNCLNMFSLTYLNICARVTVLALCVRVHNALMHW